MVQHPLHEGPHILVREDEAGQLSHTATRDKHARGGVNPYFLHRRIVHERLERPEAADVVHEVCLDLRARTLEDLVAVEMVAAPMRDFLSAAVSCGLSVLVSGGTQAGKTTLLRALAGELPRSRRVISCEEVFELGLANWDHVAMQTRPAGAEGTGEITLRDLVRESLRMRPDYLLVGEVRGPEALDLLVALNAGVPGMATVHANSAREALDKLSILPLHAGENVTTGFVTPTLASSIDLVCHVERGADGHRHIAEILAVPGRVEGNRIETASLFTYDGIRCERGSGGLDLHDRFAAAGFDLASLLEWGTA